MAHEVFAYGEFEKEPVLRRVLGRVPEQVPAKLRGFRKFHDDLLGYYNLVHDEDGVVEGQLLLAVTDDELLALDRFESAMYRRGVVTVETPTGPHEAWVYRGKA